MLRESFIQREHREPKSDFFPSEYDSVLEHSDTPLWISRTKELRTLLKVIPYDMGGWAAVRNRGFRRPIIAE